MQSLIPKTVRLPQIAKLYTGGMSQMTLAKKFGVGVTTIQNDMKELNIVPRPRTEALKLSYQKGRHKICVKHGEQHPLWKGGNERRPYRKMVTKEKCAKCGVTKNLCIHHKDFDHFNNDPKNLEVLCVNCHLSLHKSEYWKAVRRGEKPKVSTARHHWNS